MGNESADAGFLLLGFSGPRGLQVLQAGAFVAIYLCALLANALVIAVTALDPGLRTPMYFFLRKLSLFDICLISTVVPKAAANGLAQCSSISRPGCVAQVFLVPFAAATELCLLTAMAVDRYAAICQPLHYAVLMRKSVCARMATLSWLSSALMSALHTASTFSLSYCGRHRIQQFFCDVPWLLAISCSKHFTRETALILVHVALDIGCFVCILVSYALIFSAVRRMPSAAGQAKAYSTCLPHLAVVTLFLSTAFIAYLKPILGSAFPADVTLSAFYVVLPPSLNPLIYSLRNGAMKAGVEKLMARKLLTKQNVLAFLRE